MLHNNKIFVHKLFMFLQTTSVQAYTQLPLYQCRHTLQLVIQLKVYSLMAFMVKIILYDVDYTYSKVLTTHVCFYEPHLKYI